MSLLPVRARCSGTPHTANALQNFAGRLLYVGKGLFAGAGRNLGLRSGLYGDQFHLEDKRGERFDR